MGRSEGGDGASFVSGCLFRLGSVGHRQPGDPEQGPQLRPGELAVPGHQNENVVAGAATHNDGLDEVTHLDTTHRRRFRDRTDGPVPHLGVLHPEFPEPPERWGVIHETSLRRHGRGLGPDPAGSGPSPLGIRGQAPVLGRPGFTGLGVTVVVGAGVGVTDEGTGGVGASQTG